MRRRRGVCIRCYDRFYVTLIKPGLKTWQDLEEAKEVLPPDRVARARWAEQGENYFGHV